MAVFQNSRTLAVMMWVKYIWYWHKLLGPNRAFLETDQTNKVTGSIAVANASEMDADETQNPVGPTCLDRVTRSISEDSLGN
jgi:hypothetical protein